MQAHLYSLQRQWKHKFSTDTIVNRIEQAFDTLSLTSVALKSPVLGNQDEFCHDV